MGVVLGARLAETNEVDEKTLNLAGSLQIARTKLEMR